MLNRQLGGIRIEQYIPAMSENNIMHRFLRGKSFFVDHHLAHRPASDDSAIHHHNRKVGEYISLITSYANEHPAETGDALSEEYIKAITRQASPARALVRIMTTGRRSV